MPLVFGYRPVVSTSGINPCTGACTDSRHRYIKLFVSELGIIVSRISLTPSRTARLPIRQLASDAIGDQLQGSNKILLHCVFSRGLTTVAVLKETIRLISKRITWIISSIIAWPNNGLWEEL